MYGPIKKSFKFMESFFLFLTFLQIRNRERKYNFPSEKYLFPLFLMFAIFYPIFDKIQDRRGYI